jgi:hypothetical protein
MGASDLPPALDLECPDGDNACLGWARGTGWQPGSVIIKRASDWLATVKQQTGKTPIIYTYPSYLPDLGSDFSALTQYGMWMANLSSNGCMSLPAGFPTWKFWQYSWHGWVKGIPAQVDLDRYSGTMSELIAFANGGSGTPAGSCPYGNGLYCGGNGVGGSPLKLYQCTSGAVAEVKSCALGCQPMPVGQNDRCMPGSSCPYGNGNYCGGNGIGGDASTLYMCSGGTLSKIKTCSNGCKQMPTGYNDVCK